MKKHFLNLKWQSVLLLFFISTSYAQVNNCSGFRTQTQGGWSSTPSGTNPGTYLDAKFSTAFPTGLIIGCTRTLKLTTSSAVRAFLPQNTTPTGFTSTSLTNPTKSNYNNVLAGQLVTLALTLKFDQIDPNFSVTSSYLKDQRIASGIFKGWTVQQLFDEANKKIGSCTAANYSYSQYNDALNAINTNYDNATINNNFLVCPLSINGVSSSLQCNRDGSGSINVSITNGIPPYSFVWSNGATTQNLTGLQALIYSMHPLDLDLII